jgi:hypothetical protein
MRRRLCLRDDSALADSAERVDTPSQRCPPSTALRLAIAR